MTTTPIRIAGTVLRYLAPLIVILVGVVIARFLIAQRTDPPRATPEVLALPVETVLAEPGDHTWHVSAFGTVAPLRQVTLRPTVGGPVTEVHPDLVVGGRIGAGEPVVRVDRRDYELSVAVARSGLATAEADLEVERGNAQVAARELELLSGDLELTDDQTRLALREPIVAQMEAAVETARTQVAQAELALERAALVAPFDSVVTAESVELGTYLSTSTDVATLVGTDTFVVEVSLPQARLATLDRESQDVRVWPGAGATEPRAGRIARILPEVDAEGRMARLQVEVQDPLDPNSGEPLLIGSFVRVELPLRRVRDAVAIPRAALREGSRVWVVDGEDRLAFRDVSVALEAEDEILIDAGLEKGERIVTSSINTPVPSMLLEPLGAPGTQPHAAPAAATPSDAEDVR